MALDADHTAVLLCGHGSRDSQALAEFKRLAGRVRDKLGPVRLASGHLEFARPHIREGLEGLRNEGAKRILAVPGMLFAAGHVKNDIPWELNSFAADHPEIAVRYARELAIDPKLLRASAARIGEAEAAASAKIPRADAVLVVVGRGTTDPDANSNVAKLARMLWEGMGFGWAETAYSGVAYPGVDVALARARRLGFRRIVVFPYFLFTGVLVKRIYRLAGEAAARHPEIDFLAADYLCDHPLVVETLIERVNEIGAGANNMNCQLCKYRERMIGYESDLGKPQAGHHHHVRGIGAERAKDGDGRGADEQDSDRPESGPDIGGEPALP
ncbi:MAG: sirohydrochlorin chelatase [Alphaproteobacteria bacterium]